MLSRRPFSAPTASGIPEHSNVKPRHIPKTLSPAPDSGVVDIQPNRRTWLACGLALPAILAVPVIPPSSRAEVQAGFKTLRDDILAYQFDYPVTMASGQQLPLVISRKPERYSSAAPLTVDARQRIVCELVDLIDTVTISVTVGPPGTPLRTQEPPMWVPKAVAEQVLVDRSTGRITSGQRVNLNSVESAGEEERDGLRYIVFEHVSQGSPTLRNVSQETYRRALAVSAVRPGRDGTPYIYTLNLSAPSELWDEVEEGFKQSIQSFRLLPPGQKYVAPDQDPWRFF